MKILVIPDLHGITTWQAIVKEALKQPDTHIIFLGDYVDSTHIRPVMILDNLKHIIKLKKAKPDRITLLLGNHDYSYVFSKTDISGYVFTMWPSYYKLFNDNWNLFQLAWGFQGKEKYTLVTHAGLTLNFYKKLMIEAANEDPKIQKIIDGVVKELPLHDLLNCFKDKHNVMWRIGKARKGQYASGSILWADKHELISDPYPNINQIVGHTMDDMVDVINIKGDVLYFVDVHNEKRNTVSAFQIDLV